MLTQRVIALIFGLLAGLVAVVYWPGLQGDFFFDDGPSILLAEGVRFETFTRSSIYQALTSGGAGPSGRPVSQLSFALNYYFSGLDPFAFKATNLAIHLVCGVLVFSLIRGLLISARPTAKQKHILVTSSAVAVLWLLHPIQLLPVLHVVQRMTSLSALFLLAALLLHIHARKQIGHAGGALLVLSWGVFWPLSFFSKETGVLFPLFALAWELIVNRPLAGGSLDRFVRHFSILVALCLATGLVYVLSSHGQWLWSGYDFRSFSLVERLLTEGRVLWLYLGLILVPRLEVLGLYHDDVAISTGLFSPWVTLPAVCGVAGLVWLAWKLRTRAPLASFGIAWFLIGHVLESTVLPLEIAHEHRNYLPLFGILLAGGSALLHALECKGVHKTIGIAVVSVMLAYFPFVTALRAHQFGDELRRTQIEAQHHRNSARAQYEAGLSLTGLSESALPNSPIHAFARSHLELSNRLDPNSKLGWLSLIYLNCKAGIAVEQAEVNELSRRLRETPFAPGDRNLLYQLKEISIAGSSCLSRSEIDGLFAASLANPGVSPGVQVMLNSWHADYLWLHERDIAAARAALDRSLALNPFNSSNRLKWAQLILISGERQKAIKLLLELRDERLSTEERKTLNELLAADNMAGH